MTARPDEAGAAALRRLVEQLDDTAAVLAGVRGAVVWDDAAGREWTGRLDLVHRAARALADAAAADRAAVPTDPAGPGIDDGAAGWPGTPAPDAPAGCPAPPGGSAGDPVPSGDPAPGSGAEPGSGPGGVRLPGISGTRTADRRGVVAPMLPPHPGH